MKPTRRNGGHLFVYVLLKVRMEMSGGKGKEGKVWGGSLKWKERTKEGRRKDGEEWCKCERVEEYVRGVPGIWRQREEEEGRGKRYGVVIVGCVVMVELRLCPFSWRWCLSIIAVVGLFGV